MLYVPDRQALAVPSSPMIRAAVPKAPVVRWDGQDFIALPHDERTTLMLRNSNVVVDPPIQRYYDWSGTTPFDPAQIVTAGEMTIHSRMFVLNDIGTGKTRSILYAFDWLRKRKRVRKMLVAAPLSILDSVWLQEVFLHFPHLRAVVVHAADAKRRRLLLSQKADIYLINHHGLDVLKKDLVERTDIDVVAFDELAVFRNVKTDLFRAAKTVSANRAYVWGATGLPTPDAPTDIFGQVMLIRPENLRGMSFRHLRSQLMTMAGPFKWLPRKGAQKLVADYLQPCVRFTQAECVNLPPTMRVTHKATLSDEQKRAYKVMTNNMAMMYGDEVLEAANAGVLLSKLVQIGTGIVYNGDGAPVHIPAPGREQVLRDLLEQFKGSKVIVFCPFKALVRHVAGLIPGAVAMDGDIKPKDRAPIFARYQHGDLETIVAQPKIMSHGLTLTAGNVIIWYAPYMSNEVVTQANGRQARPGQTKTTYIVEVEASYAESQIYKNNSVKGAWGSVLLDVIKRGA